MIKQTDCYNMTATCQETSEFSSEYSYQKCIYFTILKYCQNLEALGAFQHIHEKENSVKILFHRITSTAMVPCLHFNVLCIEQHLTTLNKTEKSGMKQS